MKENHNDYMTPEVMITSFISEYILCASKDPSGFLEDVDITIEEW